MSSEIGFPTSSQISVVETTNVKNQTRRAARSPSTFMLVTAMYLQELEQPRKMHRFSLILLPKKKMITYVWTFHNKSSTTTIIHILYNHIVTYFYNTCVYPILDHQQIKLVSFFLAYYVYHESPWADARFQRHLHHAMFRDHFSLQTVEKTPHRTWSCWSGTRK